MNHEVNVALPPVDRGAAQKTRGGRPTRGAAAARDERLLEIATSMFLKHGFDATTIDRLAEAAGVGKATLYAHYADKNALFAAVLHRRILQLSFSLEAEFAAELYGDDLGLSLRLIAKHFLARVVSQDSIALGRILSAQALRFPELAQLAVEESWGRQVQLVEGVLRHFSTKMNFTISDLSMAAELFLSIVLGRVFRFAMLGNVPDHESLMKRREAAVQLFLRGLIAEEPAAKV